MRDQAKRLEKKLGKNDRATVEQYFTSIRDFEERIKIDRAWLDKPKPEVAALDFGPGPLEKDALLNDDGTGMRNYLKLMFDVIVLAFQTDSTRVVSHFPKGEGGPVFKDRTKILHDYHSLTHHGQLPEKLEMWADGGPDLHGVLGLLCGQAQERQGRPTARCSTIRWRPGRRPTERAGTAEMTCRSFFAAEPGWESSTRDISSRKMC